MFASELPHAKRQNNYNLSDIATKSGFKFRDIVNRKLDWKTLGCVDVNKVIDNQDYEFLERIIPKLIEAPMQSILSTAVLDPAVSSLFRLSQLSLQYLSFCQQFMDHTLFDLRTAFNHLQKKYSNLKHNYKTLEEQHYKAQERIQYLLESNGNKTDPAIIENHVKPTSLFPCDQCTKNFLTADSLRSHQQRKHSTIAEKHELSDDNEKDSATVKNDLKPSKSQPPVEKEIEEQINVSEQITLKSNNNNNGESNESCVERSKKLKISSTSVAIQCDEENEIHVEGGEEQPVQAPEQSKLSSIEVVHVITENGLQAESEQLNKHENDLIRIAYDTINELKTEIVDLRNALNSKNNTETPKEVLKDVTLLDETKFGETNVKIEVMAQKFDAFEAMYNASQHHFIESFRNLDERQKNYMNNIQETVKDIVEKSLGKYEECATSAPVNTGDLSGRVNDTLAEISNEKQADKRTVIEPIVDGTEKATNGVEPKAKEAPVKVQRINKMHESDIEWSSGSEKHETMVCQADVHTVDSGSDEPMKPATKAVKKKPKRVSKDMAKNEFEQRLRQLGIDADSAGLSTPRSQEVNQELADKREEMKKVHTSFKTTRNKLKSEVDRIAKEKLRSASSVTSLSSSHFCDDQSLEGLEDEEPRIAKQRPKSASIQKIRKRNAKKLVKKYVDNDIDESDIMDKMEMAQKAINAHRECIQELLQTTAHAPNKMTRIKYPAAATTNGTDERQMSNGENNEMNSNQYNKMPNVTTRRVVFVNLDEDS